MTIEYRNGSTVHFGGSDNFDRMVGASVRGIVLSEWATALPEAWAFFRPILAENGGWAIFATTPRGKNHVWSMLELAKKEPDWFYEVRGVNDTDVYSNQGLDAELRGYIGEYGHDQGTALFEQEYGCSFEAAILGAFYAEALRQMEAEGRIGPIELDRGAPVHTGWDLGRTDSTAIWFIQRVGRDYRLVDYYESSGAPLLPYVDKLHELKFKRNWKYGQHFFPHDAKNHELISPLSRIETLRSLGIEVEVVPAHNPLDGINAARRDGHGCRRLP